MVYDKEYQKKYREKNKERIKNHRQDPEVKAKRKEYMRNYHKENPHVLKRAKENINKKARGYRYSIRRQSKCIHCGNDDHRVLVFHHKDPSKKKYNISTMGDCSIETIKKEMAKCIILCANCHRILHHKLKYDD